jgi:hypothetical protein
VTASARSACACDDACVREFGSPIEETLLEIRLLQESWAQRGDPCGLLLGIDAPIGYTNEPPEFRPFCSWGVDGVYDGLWIDRPGQPHRPFFVLFSPMDFEEPIVLLASSVDDWLRTFSGDEVAMAIARERAAEQRRNWGRPGVGIRLR